MSSEFVGSRLSQELEQALRRNTTLQEFSKGTVLFEQGTPAAGIYLIEKGAVGVILPAEGEQTQLLEIVGPGAILGLSETMSGELYRSTALAEEPTTAAFIARKPFRDLLDARQEFCMQIVRLLSENLHALYHKFRTVSAHAGRPRRRALNERLD